MFALEWEGGLPPTAANPSAIQHAALTAQGLLAGSGGSSSAEPLLVEFIIPLASGGKGRGRRQAASAAGGGCGADIRLLDVDRLFRALGLPTPDEGLEEDEEEDQSSEEEESSEQESAEECEEEGTAPGVDRAGEAGRALACQLLLAHLFPREEAERCLMMASVPSGRRGGALSHRARMLLTWRGLRHALEGATAGQLATFHHKFVSR